MSQQPSLPRFRQPPVSEVAIGVQFQTPVLNPVHFGLYYQRIKERFPNVAVQPPLQPMFETFESAPMMMIPIPFNFMGASGASPRMWFSSQDGSSLVQLQTGRLNFNWRGSSEQNAYPHFNAVQTEFMSVLDDLHTLLENEGLPEISVNQCELIYVNPLPCSVTGFFIRTPKNIPDMEWGARRGMDGCARRFNVLLPIPIQ